MLVITDNYIIRGTDNNVFKYIVAYKKAYNIVDTDITINDILNILNAENALQKSSDDFDITIMEIKLPA